MRSRMYGSRRPPWRNARELRRLSLFFGRRLRFELRSSFVFYERQILTSKKVM